MSGHLHSHPSAKARTAGAPRIDSRLGFEGLAVEDEAILDIPFDDAGVGLFEAVVADEFDVGDDVVFGAVVEHVLRLFHSADHGAGERAAVGDEGEGRGSYGLVGKADEAEGAVET